MNHPSGGGPQKLPQNEFQLLERKEVPTLLQKKRERDELFWKLEQLDREIYAFENYDPRDVG